MPVRPYEPRDRGQALALLGDERAIDSPGHHIFLSESFPGRSDALALWTETGDGDTGCLAAITGGAGLDRNLLYRLALAACEDAIARGLSHGFFYIHDPGLLARLQRDFNMEPAPAGWHPTTRQPTRWRVEVDLHDARDQLLQALHG